MFHNIVLMFCSVNEREYQNEHSVFGCIDGVDKLCNELERCEQTPTEICESRNAGSNKEYDELGRCDPISTSICDSTEEVSLKYIHMHIRIYEAKKSHVELIVALSNLHEIQPCASHVCNCDDIDIYPNDKWTKVVCTYKYYKISLFLI